MPLNFNAANLPQMVPEYVAWVDVMGTQVSMSRSIKITANFIFKLHIAALRSQTTGIKLYPVMDGFYASSPDQPQMLDFLRNVFRLVAEEFVATTEHPHKFMIRGGLAFGPVIHGNAVGPCAIELAQNGTYADGILLGTPMVQAHLSEGSAPPFGVFVHESARVFAPNGREPLHWIWWPWTLGPTPAWNALKDPLLAHLNWCKDRTLAILYPSDRIEQHEKMVRQYFEQ